MGGSPCLYVDPISSTSRSLVVFSRLFQLPVEVRWISIKRGEHRTPELSRANPLGKVPFLLDDGMCVPEACAILTYLAQRFASQVPDTWYPADIRARTLVDAGLHWQQRTLRLNTDKVLSERVVRASRINAAAPSTAVEASEALRALQEALSQLEYVWLANGHGVQHKYRPAATAVQQQVPPRPGSPTLHSYLQSQQHRPPPLQPSGDVPSAQPQVASHDSLSPAAAPPGEGPAVGKQHTPKADRGQAAASPKDASPKDASTAGRCVADEEGLAASVDATPRIDQACISPAVKDKTAVGADQAPDIGSLAPAPVSGLAVGVKTAGLARDGLGAGADARDTVGAGPFESTNPAAVVVPVTVLSPGRGSVHGTANGISQSVQRAATGGLATSLAAAGAAGGTSASATTAGSTGPSGGVAPAQQPAVSQQGGQAAGPAVRLPTEPDGFVTTTFTFMGGGPNPCLADLLCASIVEQLRLLDSVQEKPDWADILLHFPRVRAWMARVEADCRPHFADVHSSLRQSVARAHQAVVQQREAVAAGGPGNPLPGATAGAASQQPPARPIGSTAVLLKAPSFSNLTASGAVGTQRTSAHQVMLPGDLAAAPGVSPKSLVGSAVPVVMVSGAAGMPGMAAGAGSMRPPGLPLPQAHGTGGSAGGSGGGAPCKPTFTPSFPALPTAPHSCQTPADTLRAIFNGQPPAVAAAAASSAKPASTGLWQVPSRGPGQSAAVPRSGSNPSIAPSAQQQPQLRSGLGVVKACMPPG